MAGKSNYTAEFILNLIYKGTPDAALASAVGSASSIYFALHTGDPTDSGTQASNEPLVAQWPTYARVAVQRGDGFGTPTTSGGATKIKLAAPVSFPETDAAGTGCTITHFSTGLAASGATAILHSGAVTPPITLTAGVAGLVAQLAAATEISES